MRNEVIVPNAAKERAIGDEKPFREQVLELFVVAPQCIEDSIRTPSRRNRANDSTGFRADKVAARQQLFETLGTIRSFRVLYESLARCCEPHRVAICEHLDLGSARQERQEPRRNPESEPATVGSPPLMQVAPKNVGMNANQSNASDPDLHVNYIPMRRIDTPSRHPTRGYSLHETLYRHPPVLLPLPFLNTVHTHHTMVRNQATLRFAAGTRGQRTDLLPCTLPCPGLRYDKRTPATGSPRPSPQNGRD